MITVLLSVATIAISAFSYITQTLEQPSSRLTPRARRDRAVLAGLNGAAWCAAYAALFIGVIWASEESLKISEYLFFGGSLLGLCRTRVGRFAPAPVHVYEQQSNPYAPPRFP